MTTLPSFVELMSTLGIDPASRAHSHPSTSPHSSPSSSPRLLTIPPSSLNRSRSSHSLREQGMPRNRGARYSPYSGNFLSPRRGSVSSSSSSSPELDRMSLRAYSSSPRLPPSPRLRRRVDNKLTVNVFGSSTDLSANTPISSFVRRKTPNPSPTSPYFSEGTQDDSPAASPMPFTIPTLPPLFPQSAGSDSFPLTPDSDMEQSSSDQESDHKVKPLAVDAFTRRSGRTGIRISTPPRSADFSEKRYMVHVA